MSRILVAPVWIVVLAATSFIPAAAASHCGAYVLPAMVAPAGATTDSQPLVQAVFADDPVACGLGQVSMTIDGVGVSASWFTSGQFYVVNHLPPAPLGPGAHVVTVSITETCCPTNGGSSSASMTWAFVVATVEQQVPVGLPGAGASADTPASITIDPLATVGPVYTPAVPSQTIGHTTPEIPPQTASFTTPGVAPVPVSTPEIPVPIVCAPAQVLCAGPFTVPPLSIGSTPAVPGQTVSETVPGVPSQSISQTTPGFGSIGILEETAIPPATTAALPTTAGASVEVAATTGGFLVSPAGSTPFGPATLHVPTPFGDFPVTVCAAPCPVPDPASGGASGGASAEVRAGGESAPVSVPFSLALP